MPPFVTKSGKVDLALEMSRVVPITLQPRLRASRAIDLPNPEEAPVINQMEGSAAVMMDGY